MKITLKSKESPYNLMRQCGYFPKGIDERTGQMNFARRVNGSDYPRFHVYARINSVSGETELNLHLDQKKPVYKGVTAHSGEHKGPVVEKEAERIKQILGL